MPCLSLLFKINFHVISILPLDCKQLKYRLICYSDFCNMEEYLGKKKGEGINIYLGPCFQTFQSAVAWPSFFGPEVKQDHHAQGCVAMRSCSPGELREMMMKLGKRCNTAKFLPKGSLSHLRKLPSPPKLTKLQIHQGINPPLRGVLS